MERPELLRIFHRWNPWWEGISPRIPHFRRNAFVPLQKELGENKVTAIIGPRQTGKTTLMLQTITYMIKKGENPRSILYLPIDDVRDALEEKRLDLREILTAHSEEILRKPLSESKKYIFFDEIQVCPDWSRILKILFDQKLPVKFLISGSTSSDLLKGASESLAGRISLTILPPLRYGEVVRLRLKGKYEKRGFSEARQKLGQSLQESIEKIEPLIFFNQCQQIEKLLIPVEDRMNIILQEYLERGGYPEIVATEMDSMDAIRRLRDYIDLVIQKDFVSFFHIRDPKTMDRIIRLIARHTSNIFVERTLARELGIAINTVRNYLGFLEDTYLIYLTRSYAKSYARMMRRPEKLYIIDPGLGNALVGYGEEDKGNLAETVVCSHLQSFSNRNGWKSQLFYWREKERWEVDLIWETRGKILPIEVKYRRPTALSGLDKFITDHNCWGIVISDRLKLEKNRIYVPLYLFLLLG